MSRVLDIIFKPRILSSPHSRLFHNPDIEAAYIPYFVSSSQTLIDLSWHGDISKLGSTTRIIPVTPFGEVERTYLGLTV
jgi:hypothetical protein